jgi:hypothetical protein
MSYNNVTELIAALKAMDARVRAAIVQDELDQCGELAEDKLVSRSYEWERMRTILTQITEIFDETGSEGQCGVGNVTGFAMGYLEYGSGYRISYPPKTHTRGTGRQV